MPIFIRLTLAIAAILIGLFVLVFVVKILIVAAVVAALVVGGLVVAAAVRRKFASRTGTEVMTLTARR